MSLGLLASMAAPVSAADLQGAPVYKAAAAVPVYDWSGFYVGGSVGGRWDSSDWTTTGLSSQNGPPRPLDNPARLSQGSARIGLHAGVNWQISPRWVTGIEGDIAWADSKARNNGMPGTRFPADDPGGDVASVRDRWDASLRARLGYLVTPGALLYATGGIAWLNQEAGYTCGPNSPWCSGSNINTLRTDTVSRTSLGWTVGGGLEWMLGGNWLLRGEYRYSEYERWHGALMTTGGAAIGSDDVAFDIKTRTHTALIGLSYKFGSPTVVAKY